MNSNQDFSTTTAILLFAQSEKIESASKPFAGSIKQNLLLWKKMNDVALRTIQKTKLPYFISNQNNQTGNTFGEKITSSIQEIFNKGFEKVIVVGNDCMALNVNNLLKAVHDLQFYDSVLGADFNGGVYLIGISKAEYNENLFENIPWQTKNVFTALQVLFKNQKVAYLPSLNDCNSSNDFKKAIDQLPYFSELKKILLAFLIVPKHQNYFLINAFIQQYYSLNFNKGSPIL